MFRLVAAVASSLLSILSAEARGQAAPPAAPAPIVYFAHEPHAMDRLQENRATTRRMVDQLVLAVTGKSDPGSAWSSLVKPKDRVGIKVAATGGRYFSSRVGVVEAILAGLERAGVPRRQVIVWDRNEENLRAAGFDPRELGCQVRGIEPGRGYDREAAFSAPVLGKLIWGDLLFSEKARKRRGKLPEEGDQLSSTSHLAAIVREVTKIINVPVITDDAGCGVAGALYNMTVPNLDNWRRFVQRETPASDAIPDIYADDQIGGKVVLTIMDGLLAQYAGGPAGNPNYAFAHGTIYASRDPVALDATALRMINKWRVESKLPPIGKRAEWLQTAEAMRLGAFAEERIALKPVPPR